MNFKKFFMLALAGCTFLVSCENDDDLNGVPEEEQGEYSSGIIVLNEGVFGSGNSSVAFVDEDAGTVSDSIFYKANSEAALGDVAQSIAFHEDYAFIVVNVSNKVEVVDRNTFESIATIESGLVNPRYIAFSGEQAYVSNWGDGNDPDDDYIAVINTETFSIEENIGVKNGPEKLLADDDRIYVAHEGGYTATDNDKISVINTTTNVVEEIITVGDNPVSLEIDNGVLWVAASGYPYAPNETAGRILTIDLATYEVLQEFEFPNATDHPRNLELENGLVYFTLGNSVYAFDQNEENLPESEVLVMEEVQILGGLEVENSRIYATSRNSSYTGTGDLFIYNFADGSLLESYEVGINPNEVHLQ